MLKKINNCMAILDSIANALMWEYENKDIKDKYLDRQLAAIFRAKKEINNMLMAYEGEKEREQASGSRGPGTEENIRTVKDFKI